MIRREFLRWIGKIAGGYVAVKTLPPLLRINTSLLGEAHAACANAQACGTRDCCATQDNCGAGDTTGHICSEKDICNLDESNNCTSDECSVDRSGSCQSDTCVRDNSASCENDICRRDISGACRSDRCARDSSGACTSDQCLADSSGNCRNDLCSSDSSGACNSDQCTADSSKTCAGDTCTSDKSGSCSNDQCDADKSGDCNGDHCATDSSKACQTDQCGADHSGSCQNDTCVTDNSGCSPDTVCALDGICLLDGLCPADGLTASGGPPSDGSPCLASDRRGRSQWAKGSLNNALKRLYRMSALIIFLTLTLARHPSEAAVFTVPSGDTAALINAINSANANAEDDTINLGAGAYSLMLFDPEIDVAGLPPITGVITINGSSTGATIIERSAAADPFRIFYVTSTGDLRLNRLILRGGSAAMGGAILNEEGKLSLSNCSVNGNTLSDAVDPCGGGGAIANFFGTVSLTSSSIFNNSGSCEETTSGGGVENVGGTVAITNSTVYGNSLVSNAETAAGGGVSNISGVISILNATISGNSALSNDAYGGGNVGSGGGVYGSISAKNTIFALNTATIAPDIAGGNTSLGHNLFGNLTGSLITLATGDRTGPAGLGSFIDHGLPGDAFLPLLASSQTIDAADPADFSPADQLGVTRPQGAGPDIGSIEFYPRFAVSAPASATSGTAFSFTVTAQDQFSNTFTGYAGIVHFTSSDTAAVLPANTTLTDGVGTFPATLRTTGSRTITATDTVTAAITGTSGNITVNAAASLSIAFAGNGSGTVTSTSPDSAINCIKGSSSGCSASYTAGTSVTLAATGDWKSLFTGWSNGVTSSANPVTFTMDADKTVTATFDPNYKAQAACPAALSSPASRTLTPAFHQGA